LFRDIRDLEDEGVVLKTNSHTLKVEQRWPTAPCASPGSMAMDRANLRLFLGCRSKVLRCVAEYTVHGHTMVEYQTRVRSENMNAFFSRECPLSNSKISRPP
jgi:hypothetical protein